MESTTRELCYQAQTKAAELTITGCEATLIDLVNMYTQTTLVLDALDECEKDQRIQLIGVLNNVLENALKPVKIFVSSRPDGDIKEMFENEKKVYIQAADNQNDISKFIRREIVKHRRWKRMDVTLREDIVETLQTRAGGM